MASTAAPSPGRPRDGRRRRPLPTGTGDAAGHHVPCGAGSASATVNGPAATVSGPDRDRRPGAAARAPRPARRGGRGAGTSGSSRRRARRRPWMVRSPIAASQIGSSGTGGWPSRSGRAPGGGVELSALAGEQRPDLGRDLPQLVGRPLEGDVVEALHQRPGAGAESEDVAALGEPVQRRGGHRQRGRGAPPDREDGGHQRDPPGAQRRARSAAGSSPAPSPQARRTPRSRARRRAGRPARSRRGGSPSASTPPRAASRSRRRPAGHPVAGPR